MPTPKPTREHENPTSAGPTSPAKPQVVHFDSDTAEDDTITKWLNLADEALVTKERTRKTA